MAQSGERKSFGRGRLIAVLLLAVLVVGVVGLAFVNLNLQRADIPSGTPSGELAFVSNRSGTWDVWVIDASGELRALTDGDEYHDYFVSYDFASERMNFLSARSGELGPAQVWPDGTNLRSLGILDAVTTMFFEGRINWDPAWSPDGTRLAFSSLRDLNLEVYLSDNEEEADALRLTNGGARDWFAAWSPDGTRLAFSSDREGAEDVYVMDADGENVRRLTDAPANDIHGAWSLDGATLLFVSERDVLLETGDMRLYTLDPDAENPTAAPLGDAVFEGDPVWSSDGGEVVYMSNQDGSWSLYIMNADGSNLRRLTDNQGDDLFPVWRPAVRAADGE